MHGSGRPQERELRASAYCGRISGSSLNTFTAFTGSIRQSIAIEQMIRDRSIQSSTRRGVSISRMFIEVQGRGRPYRNQHPTHILNLNVPRWACSVEPLQPVSDSPRWYDYHYDAVHARLDPHDRYHRLPPLAAATGLSAEGHQSTERFRTDHTNNRRIAQGSHDPLEDCRGNARSRTAHSIICRSNRFCRSILTAA